MSAPPEFHADIQPLLAKHCFKCHGPEKHEGGLRLNDKQSALAGGDSGLVIVPGRSGESELLRRIASTDRDEAMPPEGRRLSEAEVALVRGWIDAGANWPAAADKLVDKRLEHWAWSPLVRPTVPNSIVSQPKNRSWPRNDVDRFIAAKLEAIGLAPSPEADRRTLIRRLYFDLIGLPPTDAEVEAFVADRDPRAYETLVDRLLDLPAYGERWARHWLDVVHYGETHGYDKDRPRPNAWPYRDYVIRAFNSDKPYARFIEEQIAGDVLYPHTVDGITALGFIAAGPWDAIGHQEVPETKRDGRIARHTDRDDMLGNTIGTFNSLTVQCAQCHAHKFDPIPQEDYYRLHAVFAAVDRTDKPFHAVPNIEQQYAALAALEHEQQRHKDTLEAEVATAAGPELAKIDQRLREMQRRPGDLPAEYGYHSQLAADPDTIKWAQVDLQAAQDVAEIVLVGCFDDFNNIGAGFGFPLRYRVELAADSEFRRDVTTLVDQTEADVANPGIAPQRFAAAGRGRYVRVTATRLARRKNDYMFALAELVVRDKAGQNLAANKPVASLDSIEAAPRWRRANLVDGRLPGGKEALASETVAELRARREALVHERVPEALREKAAAARRALAETEKNLKALPPPQLVYAATVHYGRGSFAGTGPSGGKPRSIHVLQRGDVDRPLGEEVAPGALSLLPALPAKFELASDAPEGERRAALARWLSSRDNPLTWRSIVNRVWLYHFGRGIVDTPNDFGHMGQPPSHPELLDWLAVEFRDGGGSLKKLHRLLVTSSTYRQVSTGRAEAEKIDAGNQWLWRMSRRRLEAEALRDAMLAISGRLDPRMGGPSFEDFAIEQPQHSPHYEYAAREPDDPAVCRRSIYRFIVRSQPQPLMTVLDCADPSQRVDKRNQSLSPLQALAMLNDGFVVTMSQHLAERLAREGKDTAARVERAFRQALGRPPRDDERHVLVTYADRFGLPNLCRLLFNLNEFTFVD